MFAQSHAANRMGPAPPWLSLYSYVLSKLSFRVLPILRCIKLLTFGEWTIYYGKSPKKASKHKKARCFYNTILFDPHSPLFVFVSVFVLEVNPGLCTC